MGYRCTRALMSGLLCRGGYESGGAGGFISTNLSGRERESAHLFSLEVSGCPHNLGLPLMSHVPSHVKDVAVIDDVSVKPVGASDLDVSM